MQISGLENFLQDANAAPAAVQNNLARPCSVLVVDDDELVRASHMTAAAVSSRIMIDVGCLRESNSAVQ